MRNLREEPASYTAEMSDPVSPEIEALLREDRSFAPSEEFRKNAVINDPEIYARAAAGSGTLLGRLCEGARVD